MMICRLNTLTLGKSGVRIGVINTLEAFLREEIYPVIYSRGGVGASGDLVQLAHLAFGLIGEGEVSYQGKVCNAQEVLASLKIQPLELKLRDGLGLLNGTSCMSGIALLNVWDSKIILDWAVQASTMVNELVKAFDDSFSINLNSAKLHEGQREIAQKMTDLLADSKRISRRADYFYQNPAQQSKKFDQKVQEYYSLRCVPQILGPIHETIQSAQKTVINEIGSANDNPIIDLEAEDVFHGGNFHGDYISFEMDKLKIGVTKLCMLLERQLNFLLNDKLNNVLPPFLNKGTLGLNFGLQGMQFVATSSTAENQALSNSMYVHSIPSNNDNQDIVSMGANSALLASKVIENTYTVLSIEMIAIAQAIDILNCEDEMSSNSQKMYAQLKELVRGIDNDSSGSDRIAKVRNLIRNSHNMAETKFELN